MGGASSIIQAAATLVGAAATAASTVKSMTAKQPKTAKAPTVTPVATAPTRNDANIETARREAILRRQQAGGRQSTILTDETLG